MPSTNIILIDTNKLSREGLRAIFSEGDFRVTTLGASLDSAMAELTEPCDAGIILLDRLALRDVSAEIHGLKARCPDAHIVILTGQMDMQDMCTAIQAGADGILMKDISVEALAQSMRLVMAGEKVFPTQLAVLLVNGRLTGAAPLEPQPNRSGLSRRELQILRHLVTGESNKTIALHLHITEATVKVHLKTLLRKINATNRTQAAIWALNHGLADSTTDASGQMVA